MQTVTLMLCVESSRLASSKYGVKQHEGLVITDKSSDEITQTVM